MWYIQTLTHVYSTHHRSGSHTFCSSKTICHILIISQGKDHDQEGFCPKGLLLQISTQMPISASQSFGTWVSSCVAQHANMIRFTSWDLGSNEQVESMHGRPANSAVFISHYNYMNGHKKARGAVEFNYSLLKTHAWFIQLFSILDA